MNEDSSKTFLWGVVALTVAALAAVTTLAALGKPIDTVMSLVLSLVGPTVTSLVVLLQVHKVGKDVSVVKEQTNGNMTKLLEKIPAAATPVADVPAQESTQE